MIQFDFSNKTVLVVGGTSGINQGIAFAFAQHGAKVAVASRTQEKVDATVEALQELGAEATGFTADVRDYEALVAGMASVNAQLGKIHTLVSGAAGNFPALANQMSSNAFKSVVDIDLLGSYNVLRSAYSMMEKGGNVVNISAPQALLPMLGQSHVCAAKAGVDMLTKTLALEWGVDGVRVNGIIPGPVAGTEGMKRLAPSEELIDMCRRSVPLQRLPTPEDIGHTALFLASPLASCISGAIIPVDGGWSLGGAALMAAGMEHELRKTT